MLVARRWNVSIITAESPQRVTGRSESRARPGMSDMAQRGRSSHRSKASSGSGRAPVPAPRPAAGRTGSCARCRRRRTGAAGAPGGLPRWAGWFCSVRKAVRSPLAASSRSTAAMPTARISSSSRSARQTKTAVSSSNAERLGEVGRLALVAEPGHPHARERRRGEVAANARDPAERDHLDLLGREIAAQQAAPPPVPPRRRSRPPRVRRRAVSRLTRPAPGPVHRLGRPVVARPGHRPGGGEEHDPVDEVHPDQQADADGEGRVRRLATSCGRAAPSRPA